MSILGIGLLQDGGGQEKQRSPTNLCPEGGWSVSNYGLHLSWSALARVDDPLIGAERRMSPRSADHDSSRRLYSPQFLNNSFSFRSYHRCGHTCLAAVDQQMWTSVVGAPGDLPP